MTADIRGFHIIDNGNGGYSFGEDSSENGPPNQHISIIYDYELSNFTYVQRISLSITVIILSVMAIVGNVATLFANSKRKKCRPFFRSCLISLAVSDLITVIFTSLNYLTQFTSTYIQCWSLGATMCNLIPFITTAALLVSSMNLVGIALDRYLAVMRAFNNNWIFGKFFYITCLISMWGLSIGIASPLITFYSQVEVYIIDTTGKNLTIESVPVKMCASKKEDNTYYFVVVLSIIFVPTLLAFIWLNTVLAQKLFSRRHLSASGEPKAQGNTESSKTTSTSLPVISNVNNEPKNHETNASNPITAQASQREALHLKMIYVLTALMAVFIVLRLPAWIFLIMRLYGNYTRPVDWVLHYVFGILTLASCVLNPLLYTFLTETIYYCDKVRKNCLACLCCTRLKSRKQTIEMENIKE